MCLIALGLGVSRDYALVLAANRDERHTRATAAADWWPEDPPILAGRDLVAGGSWLGVDRKGRVAALTNFLEAPHAAAPRSRGELVADFLRAATSAATFSERVGPRLHHYGAFNLLLFDGQRLHYLSNRAPERALGEGIHVLSNAEPGVDWPKIHRARTGLAAWIAQDSTPESLLDWLGERDARGTGPTRYRESLFIEGAEYGTRCSTVLLVRRTGAVTFLERRFDAAGRDVGEGRYEFELDTAGASSPGPELIADEA
jgi:uncharacterized protein with NRDE domain